jgi:hypothetical protein
MVWKSFKDPSFPAACSWKPLSPIVDDDRQWRFPWGPTHSMTSFMDKRDASYTHTALDADGSVRGAEGAPGGELGRSAPFELITDREPGHRDRARPGWTSPPGPGRSPW